MSSAHLETQKIRRHRFARTSRRRAVSIWSRPASYSPHCVMRTDEFSYRDALGRDVRGYAEPERSQRKPSTPCVSSPSSFCTLPPSFTSVAPAPIGQVPCFQDACGESSRHIVHFPASACVSVCGVHHSTAKVCSPSTSERYRLRVNT